MLYALVVSVALAAGEPPLTLDREVVELTQSLGDWDEQAKLIETAITNMWADNGWNSEADLAARNAALEISRIPPWNLTERFDRLGQIVDQRYALDGGQSNKFRSMVFKETTHMALKYGPLMMRETKELLRTRARGEPFTPELIADLERAFDPVIDDVLRDMDRITTDMNDMLTPQQREVFRRDLESFEKRKTHFLAAREEWKAGQWEPAAWGLQDDPIHREAAQRAQAAALPVLGQAIPHDETTWHRHVDAVITHYALDSAQQNAARAVLEGAVAAAASYRSSRRDEIRALAVDGHATDPLLEPIRAGFAILQVRLDGLPTERQRRTVGPTEPVESRRGQR